MTDDPRSMKVAVVAEAEPRGAPAVAASGPVPADRELPPEDLDPGRLRATLAQLAEQVAEYPGTTDEVVQCGERRALGGRAQAALGRLGIGPLPPAPVLA